jgi:hypothetical protein
VCDPADPLDFPDLPDEAVIAINDFLEEFYTRFQNHYFAQMLRCDFGRRPRPHPQPAYSQMTLPLSDPPF